MWLAFVTITVSLLLVKVAVVSSGESYQFSDRTLPWMEAAISSLEGPFAAIAPASKLFDIAPAQDKTASCSPSIIRVTHLASLDKDNNRPQLFISGEIHGDERVGPLAAIATAQLLVWSAMCEVQGSDEHCDKVQDMFSVTKDQRKWLAFLATRRDTFIVPTTNCLGYLEDSRYDAGVDPNRDFPYSRQDTQCFKSTTARIINALMRDTLTQIVVTYHGGMVALGYEWGSRNHMSPDDQSPDDVANSELAQQMRDFAGGWKGEKNYPIGRINSIIYFVDGGMEDWLYAAGWDKALNKPCDVMKDKVAENNRALVFLVETSAKHPQQSTLGQTKMILNPKEQAPVNGHVSRNVRLGLVAVDIVQPYVCISAVNSAVITDKVLMSTIKAKSLQMDWSVGGANTVDYSFLAWHRPPTSFDITKPFATADWTSYLQSLEPPIPFSALQNHRHVRYWRQRQLRKLINDSSDEFNTLSIAVDQLRGNNKSGINAQLASKVYANMAHTSRSVTTGSAAKFSFNVTAGVPTASGGSRFLAPGDHWLVAWTIVDLKWGNKDQGFPNGQSESYLSNARTNPNWYKKSSPSTLTSDRVVQGRVMWPSEPIAVRVFKDHTMQVMSATFDCAWWSRTTAASIHPLDSHPADDPDDESSTQLIHPIVKQQPKIVISGNESAVDGFLRTGIKFPQVQPTGDIVVFGDHEDRELNQENRYLLSIGMFLMVATGYLLYHYRCKTSFASEMGK